MAILAKLGATLRKQRACCRGLLLATVALGSAAAAAPDDDFDSAVSRPVVQALPGGGGSYQLNAALTRLAANPADVGALIEAGNAALALGDDEAARGFLNRADQLSPGNPQVKVLLAGVMVRNADPFEALRLFDEAERAGASVTVLAGERGLAYDLVGAGADAQRYYRQALASAPSDEIYRRLALSQAIAGDRKGFEGTLLPQLKRNVSAAWRARVFGLAILGSEQEAIGIAQTTMPRDLSQAIIPYLRYMPRLTPAQQAAAANFGHFPRAADIGRDDARVARFASSSTRRPGVGAGLIPAGQPLGRVAAAQPARVSKAEERRRLKQMRDEVRVRARTEEAQARARRRALTQQRVAARTGGNATARRPGQATVVGRAPQAATAAPRAPQQGLSSPWPQAASGAPAVSGRPVPTASAAAPPAVQYNPTPSTAPAPLSVLPPTSGPSATTSAPVPWVQPGVAPGATSPAPSAYRPPAVLPSAAPASAPSPTPITLPSAGFSADPLTIPTTGIMPLGAGETGNLREAPPEPPSPSRRTVAGAAPQVRAGSAGARNARAEKPAVPSHASRIWVQLATGRDQQALAFDWQRLSRQAGEVVRGRKPSITPGGQGSRLLVGPFESQAAAQSFLNLLAGKNISALVWTSAAGQVVDRLATR